MNVVSYRGVAFVVEDNETRIRLASDLTRFEAYRVGEVRPPGKAVGDLKVIPKRTEVLVTDTRLGADRTVFVLVQPAVPDPAIPSGWTKASNLRGRFINEFLGTAPAAAPSRVIDTNALVRTGPSRFAPVVPARTIPVDTLVLVTAMSSDGKFVKVRAAELVSRELRVQGEIGWTAVSNLAVGSDAFFASAGWRDEKGPNACWEGGRFSGARVLMNVVGTGGEMEQVPLDALAPYLELCATAARRNVELSINSGFRTFGHQAALFQAHQADPAHNPLAAPPGKSNHQHGQAFDLNTGDFDGDPVYDWLKRNGPGLGFIRTVSKEHWHWEYRPDEAARLAQEGLFKLKTVRV